MAKGIIYGKIEYADGLCIYGKAFLLSGDWNNGTCNAIFLTFNTISDKKMICSMEFNYEIITRGLMGTYEEITKNEWDCAYAQLERMVNQ